MSDMIDKLWPAFKAEVDEQLESIEASLISAEQGQTIDIRQLFRDFHTIKSSFAMMGLASMEAIAHAAEDFLDEVRNGRSELQSDNVSLLLKALDSLNEMLQEVEETKTDPAPAPELVERLCSLAGNSDNGSDAPASADNTAEKTLPAELLDFLDFSENLGGALTADGDSLQVDPELTGHLADKAAAAGFSAIEALLRQLPDSQPQALPEVLSRLLARMEQVAHLVEDPALLATAHEILRPWAAPALLAELENIREQLNPGRPGERSLDRALSQAVQWCVIAGLPRSAQLLRLCRQILRQYAREYRHLPTQTTELIAAGLGMIEEQLEAGPEDELFQSLCEQTTGSLYESISDKETQTSLRERLENAARQLKQRPELLDALTESGAGHLINAIDRDDHIAEIDADLESDRSLAEKLAQWLSERAEVIDSRTVFVNATDGTEEHTRVRFLIAYAGSAGELEDSLRQLDPEAQYLRLYPCSFTLAPERSRDTETRTAARKSDSIRIDSERLDGFVGEIGQLMMLHNMLNHSLMENSSLAETRQASGWAATLRRGGELDEAQRQRLAAFIDNAAAGASELVATHEKMDAALQQLQNSVMELRVVPVELLFSRLPRAVRNVSVAQGKEVRMATEGAEVLVDKSIVDALVDPLIHMVRNAVDHGIESPEQRERHGKPRTAILSLSARSTGNSLILDIGDDGRGLDFEAIRQRAMERELADPEAIHAMGERELADLIFTPGFSTSTKVTETSGRGVGMDVVRSRVSQLGGRITVSSETGGGTRFHLTLPLSAAIQGVLLVRAGGQPVAIPERNVSEIIAVDRDGIQTLQGQAAIIHQEAAVPVFDLHRLLYPSHPMPAGQSDAELEVVIVSNGKWRMGLAVGGVVGRQGIFVRDVHPEIANLPAVAGASVLGDGSVTIILDCEHLMTLAASQAQSARILLEAS